MRYALGLLVVLAVVSLFGVSGSAAACRAAGEYRVNGPTSAGWLTLKETRSEAASSSGTFNLTLYPRGGCPICDFGGRILTGEYVATPLNWDGSCVLLMKVFDPMSSQRGELGGTRAFGGSVIFFENWALEVWPPTLFSPDLNLTLGFRLDALLRP